VSTEKIPQKVIDRRKTSMKDYFKLLTKLIEKHGKAKVAVCLDIKDIKTIDRWYDRELIPAKYLDKIKELR
jgi:hypothetical protein